MQANLQILPNFSLGQATRRGTFSTERLFLILCQWISRKTRFESQRLFLVPEISCHSGSRLEIAILTSKLAQGFASWVRTRTRIIMVPQLNDHKDVGCGFAYVCRR